MHERDADEQAAVATLWRALAVRSGGEAANLIHSIVASAPAEQIPPLVTAAVEANPQYGQEVVQAAIERASPSELAAIVTSVYFALSQNPSTPKPLLDYVSDLVHGRSVPTNSADASTQGLRSDTIRGRVSRLPRSGERL